MLTKDEQLEVMLEVMQRLAPEIAARRTSIRKNNRLQRTSEEPLYPGESEDKPLPEPTSQPSWRSPNLHNLLNRLGPLPPFTAVIGLCEDGLPFLFDLADPTPGSILIAGDRQSGKTRLVRSILTSACYLNLPQEVNINLITTDPSDYLSLAGNDHCQMIVSPYERQSAELVYETAVTAEQRRNGRHLGGAHVLVIDDLPSLMQYKEYDVLSHLRWLLKHGPKNGVWVIATLRAEDSHTIDRRLLSGFGTRLIGSIKSAQLVSRISGYSDPVLHSLWAGGQFAALFGNEWVKFWIPVTN